MVIDILRDVDFIPNIIQYWTFILCTSSCWLSQLVSSVGETNAVLVCSILRRILSRSLYVKVVCLTDWGDPRPAHCLCLSETFKYNKRYSYGIRKKWCFE